MTLIVAASLVLSSFLLPGALNALDRASPVSGNYESIPPQSLPHGTLVVKVLVGNSNGSANSSVPAVVPNEHIWLAASDRQLDRRIFLYTNSSGVLQIELMPTSLIVEVTDDRFNLLVPVQVFAGKITSVTIVGNRVAHGISFAEVSDRYSSGWATDADRIYLGIHSTSSSLNSTDFVFIEPYQNALGVTKPAPLVRAVLLGEAQRQGMLWVEVRPYVYVPVSDLARGSLVTYVPSYTVVVVPKAV
jgi:hypothetical protein